MLSRTLGIAVALALIIVTPLTASQELTLDDILRLHEAGVSDEVIMSEVIVTDSRFDLDVDDILRLTEIGVSSRLVKFLIDTGLEQDQEVTFHHDSTSDADYDEEFSYADDYTIGDLSGDGSYSEGWLNSVEEEEDTTTWWVSLNYNYGSWWYDCYWSDYWYYDVGYSPYRVSYSWSLGAWHPGWYSYWNVYSPPYWGYGSRYWYTWGYGNYQYPWWCYSDPYWYYPSHHHHGYHQDHYDQYAHHHHGSDTKYKTGHRGGDKPIRGGGRLELPDGRRWKVEDKKLDDRRLDDRRPPRVTELALDTDDRRGDVRRPTLGGGVRVGDGRKDVRPPVRTPIVDTDRPVRPKPTRIEAPDHRRPDRPKPTRIEAPDSRKPQKPTRVEAPERDRPVRIKKPTRRPARLETPGLGNPKPPTRRPPSPDRVRNSDRKPPTRVQTPTKSSTKKRGNKSGSVQAPPKKSKPQVKAPTKQPQRKSQSVRQAPAKRAPIKKAAPKKAPTRKSSGKKPTKSGKR